MRLLAALGRLSLTAALAACAGAPLPAGAPPAPSSAAASDAAAPRRSRFPATHAGVHLNLVFNYGVPDVNAEIGVVDVVWGASAPRPRHVFNLNYTTFQREDTYGPHPFHSLAWWKAHHPDWIEYRCDRKTVAYEFHEIAMPLDIANPAFWAYQRQSAVDPALKAGYQGIAFDNLDLGNGGGRCGHYSASGAWVAQYSGNYVDPAYARDVIAWAHDTFAYVHAFSPAATMAINDSYDFGLPLSRNLALMTQTDMVLDERGFTNWGSKQNHPTTAQ